MSGRPGLRGPGYMPKGGVKAAQAHNRAVWSAMEAAVHGEAERGGAAPSRPSPSTGRHAADTGVRASVRPGPGRGGLRGPTAAIAGLAGGLWAYQLGDWLGILGGL